MRLTIFTLLCAGVLGVGAGRRLSPTPPARPASFGVGRSQFHINTRTETTLLAYNVSTFPFPATASINFFWVTGDPLDASTGRAGVDVAIWRFYIDGEAVPSLQVQTSQAAFVGDADPTAPWSNEYFGKNSKFGGWHVAVPIPFSTSVRVTLQLPSWWPTSDERIFAMCRGVEGVPIQLGSTVLPQNARLVASVMNSSALAPLAEHELISLPEGTAGLMLGAMIDLVLYGPGAGSLNSLEGCWHAYTPPSAPFPGWLLGTGAEDYPESAYYFNAGPYRSLTSGLTVMSTPDPELARVSFFKLHSHRDAFFFNNGFRFVWRNGDITDPTTGEKCIVQEGKPIGTPSLANVTTLVYAYIW